MLPKLEAINVVLLLELLISFQFDVDFLESSSTDSRFETVIRFRSTLKVLSSIRWKTSSTVQVRYMLV